MKTRSLTLAFLLFASITSFSQQWDTAWNFRGISYAECVSNDNYGNVFILSDIGALNLKLDSAFSLSQGVALVKYDKNANVVWALSLPINVYNNHPGGKNMIADKAGDVFVTGTFSGNTATFGTQTVSGTYFLVKIDGSSGKYLWAQGSSGAYTANMPRSLTVDKSGNVTVAGFFNSHYMIFQGDTLTNIAPIVNDMPFIVKYDCNGNLKWAKTVGIKDQNSGCSYDLANDAKGNIYLTSGFYDTSFVFGKDTIINHHIGYHAFYILKYDSNGNPLWGISGNGGSYGQAVACDSSGNVYLAGSFFTTPLIFPSKTLYGTGLFLTKFDKNGNFMWADGISGSIYDGISAAATDISGNCYITGSFTSSVLYFGAFNLQITPHSNSDMYIAECDENGNFLWGKHAGRGAGSEDITYDNAANALYVTGIFCDTSIIFSKDTLDYPTSCALFVAKLGLPDISALHEAAQNKHYLNLFPNPNNGVFTIQSSVDRHQSLVEIFNVLGEKVYSSILRSSLNTLYLTQPSGLYLYRVTDKNNNLVEEGKFVIEK